MHHFFRFSRSDTGTAHKKNAWTALQTNFFFTRRTENVGEAQRDTIVPGQTNFRTATFAWCVSREKTKRVWPVQAFLIWKPRKIKYQRCSTIVFESALFVFPFFTCKAKRTIKASVFFLRHVSKLLSVSWKNLKVCDYYVVSHTELIISK